MARSRKLNLKSILRVVVFAALAILLIGGISSCFGDDTDNVSIFKFERGELDSNGEHVESKRAVYTKTAFECIGLEIIPDFDAHASYDVYYYDVEDNFIDSVTGLTKKYIYDHPFATHARVVIYPDVPEDESEEDYEIPFYEVYTIANKLSITVSEKQKQKINLYDELTCEVGSGFLNTNVGDKFQLNTFSGLKVTDEIIVSSGYEKFDIYATLSNTSYFKVLACSSSDVILVSEESYTKVGNFYKITLDLTEATDTVEYFRCLLSSDSKCYIFGYKK